MGYGNYGGGGGWGGQRRQPKPRPILPAEHELNPRHEGVLKSKGQLSKDYHSPGDTPSRETLLFETDPKRASIPVPNAAMIIKMQSGYPLNHPDHPAIAKHKSEFPASDYYFVHASPVIWEHDSNFRYIPTYSRYVIDKFGRVLNAYNGKPVEPEKGGFAYKLVADGPVNNPYYAQKEKLMVLAWTPLPEGFVDYGMGTYSHTLDVDVAAGTYGWCPRPGITVRNNDTGRVDKYANLPEFVQCVVKDFKLKPEFRPYIRDGLKGDVVNIGPFSIKETEPGDQPGALPVVTPGAEPGSAAPAQESAPQQEQAPAPQPEPEPQFDSGGFDDIDF